MSEREHDVVIVGSGIGGLTAGALLSQKGLDVLVLEQNWWVGGCCSSRTKGDFTHDVGAVFILGQDIYRLLFRLLERDLDKYLDLILIDTPYQAILGDEDLLIPRDPEAMAEVIAKISPDDVKGWWRYVDDMTRFLNATDSLMEIPVSLEQFGTPSHLLKLITHPKELTDAFRHLRRIPLSHTRVINKYFSHRTVRMLMSFETTYAGLSPRQITSLFMSLQMMRHLGYEYPRGGMGMVPGALRKILEENGGEVRTGSKVTKILVKDKKAQGVELEDGQRINSRSVLSNVSAITTYLDLVGRENLTRMFARAIEGYSLSFCAPIMHIGLNRKPPTRAHMTVLARHPENFEEYFEETYYSGYIQRAEDIPWLVVSPSHTDPSMAPPGGGCLTIMTALPYDLHYSGWDDIKEEYTEYVIDFLDKEWIPGLSGQVVEKWLMTPLDLERTYGYPGGPLYGIEMSLPNLGPFRPSWRSPVIKDLYLAGAWTAPGSGVPLVMTSGIMCAARLIQGTPGR